jgi:hypothetical protein
MNTVSDRQFFPDTLRISDVSLSRLINVLRLLDEKRVIVTIHAMLALLIGAERAAGYNYQMDKKSLTKCLLALRKESLLTMHDISVVDDGVPHRVTLVCHRDIVDPEGDDVHIAVHRVLAEFEANGQLRIMQKSDKKQRDEDDTICNSSMAPYTIDQLNQPMSFDERIALLRQQLAMPTIALLPDACKVESTTGVMFDSVGYLFE